MDKEERPYSVEKHTPPSKGVREALESLRTIFVAAIAAVISIAEWIYKRFSNLQAKAEVEAKVAEERRAEENANREKERKEKEKLKVAEERVRIAEERKAKEQAKIAEESRAEERAIREEERKAKEQKFSPKKIVYPTLSGISTIALIIGVAMLAPISKWTRSQNECIELTSGNTDSSRGNFPNKVMRCNGGHE